MSETETRLMEAEALLADWVTEKTAPAPHRLDLSLPPDALVAAVQKLHEAGWGYLAAITGLHHSEGPHRFLGYGRLQSMIRDVGFDIEHSETTVLIPAGPDWFINFGYWLEARTKNTLMPLIGLRRLFICRWLWKGGCWA